MSISREVLTRLGATAANADAYLDPLNAAMAAHGIDSALRIAHFLAQVMHESGSLKTTVENMRYSAERLRAVFPRYFPTAAEAAAYANQPARIGSRVYGGRMGNGPEASGDGYLYRGRGLIQLTGKANYRAFSAWIGDDVVAHPELVATRYAAQSAVYFWDKNALNALADLDDLNTITRRINGGLNGFAHRRELLEKAKRALAELAGRTAVELPSGPALKPTHRVVPLSLNLRSAPRVADNTRMATLNQGSPVEVLGAAPEAGWVRLRALVNGVLREGFAAERYLEPLPRGRARAAAPVLLTAAAPVPAVPPAHLQQNRSDITRARDGGRAYPLGEAGRPTRSGRTAEALAAAVSAIVDYLDVANPAHRRYQPGGGNTYCNIYATDFAYLCGVYLPRVWWTDPALRRLHAGETVPVAYGQTVRELNANSLFDWLEDHGSAFGWVPEVDLTTLQAAANAGEVCVIVGQRAELNRPGHITVVVPEQDGARAKRNAGGEVLHPLESQAGTRNVLRAAAASAWWLNARFRAHAFWRHP